MSDPALVFLDNRYGSKHPGTHVLIVAAGYYDFGKNGPSASATSIARTLSQVTSAPPSARAIANWFLSAFESPDRPLASISLLISDDSSATYELPASKRKNAVPATGARRRSYQVPSATFPNVRAAARAWVERASVNPDNMTIFYFCGHGIAQGQQAALLLREFGDPSGPLDDAIDVIALVGTMRNCPAKRQLFFFDCCRTAADDLYRNNSSIGQKLVSLVAEDETGTDPALQFVLFATQDGEEAFGIKDDVSVFTRSLVDALSFAAADAETGPWCVNTGSLLKAVERLVQLRVPPGRTSRAKPNSPNATSFDICHISNIGLVRSIVSLSDPSHWGKAHLRCKHPTNNSSFSIDTSTILKDRCGRFEVDEGRWTFDGNIPGGGPRIESRDSHVRLPVAYVKLDVVK